MLLFGVCFMLYFIKLSAGKGFFCLRLLCRLFGCPKNTKTINILIIPFWGHLFFWSSLHKGGTKEAISRLWAKNLTPTICPVLGLLLRNQPACFFLKLVELLTPDDRPNWKELAAEFRDFTWDEIATFAVDKNLSAEKMLCAWQTKNTSTVDKLHQCLINIKREDVATYVAESVNGETHTVV